MNDDGTRNINNVIIENKNQNLYQSLITEIPEINIVAKKDGVFDADEIVSNYKNYRYGRMIIDITAIKDYHDIRNLQKLSINLDMSRVVLLLDDTPDSTSPYYLSKLVSLGIYNFSQTIEGVIYLCRHPQTYSDVAQYHIIDNSAPVSPKGDHAGVQYTGPRIIGIKSITKGAGATTLIYMMKSHLEQNYSVVAIEVDKHDFLYFSGKNLYSTSSSNIGNTIAKYSSNDVILIDINNSDVALELCKEAYYLLQPTTIELRRLMNNDRTVLDKYRGKRVILNQSLVNSQSVSVFEEESRLKVFYNLPPLDERNKNNKILNTFLSKIGFTKQDGSEAQKKGKLFGII